MCSAGCSVTTLRNCSAVGTDRKIVSNNIALWILTSNGSCKDTFKPYQRYAPT